MTVNIGLAICVWDEKTKLGQYRNLSWDGLGEYSGWIQTKEERKSERDEFSNS